MLERTNRLQRARKADRGGHFFHKTADPSKMSSTELSSSIYSLQARNFDGRYAGRIRILVQELSTR